MIVESAVIATTRLRLQVLGPEDVDDVFDYARDPEVARHTSWPAHETVDDARQFVSFVLAADSDVVGSLRHTWAIRLKEMEKVVGTVDLVQDDGATAHVDFALARPFWNLGYMTEAVNGVVAWGFGRLEDLERVRSGCLAANVGSRRVLEKVGFQERAHQMIQFGEKFGFQTLEVTHYELPRTTYGGTSKTADTSGLTRRLTRPASPAGQRPGR